VLVRRKRRQFRDCGVQRAGHERRVRDSRRWLALLPPR
jgi:hypothetical protein